MLYGLYAYYFCLVKLTTRITFLHFRRSNLKQYLVFNGRKEKKCAAQNLRGKQYCLKNSDVLEQLSLSGKQKNAECDCKLLRFLLP